MMLLQKYQSYHVTQQIYSWASTQKKWTCVHTKTGITIRAGAWFMAIPKRNIPHVHQLTKNKLWSFQRQPCSWLVQILDFVLLTKKGLYTAEMCLGHLRQEWKRGGRWAGRGEQDKVWLRKVAVTWVLERQQDQWGQRQVEGAAVGEAVGCRSMQQEVWIFWSGVCLLSSICVWPDHKGPAF